MSLLVNLLLVSYALLIFLFAGYEKITLVGFPSLPDDKASSLPLDTPLDSIHATDSLTRTVAYLQSSKVDLVTLAPQTILKTFWEKLLQPVVFYLIMVSVGGKWVNDDRRPNYSIGNGQYMLITRAAYEKIGGHKAVHDRIVEDLSMARNLKRAGLKLRFLVAQDAFGVRMYSSLREIWLGWRKNFYT